MTMALGNQVLNVWHIAAVGLGLLLSVLATGHVVLNKRDSRAAIAWVGFVWLVPMAGAVMYFIFGVNRIRHKAALLRGNLERYRAQTAGLSWAPATEPARSRNCVANLVVSSSPEASPSRSPSACRKSCSATCRITEGISRCWFGSSEAW